MFRLLEKVVERILWESRLMIFLAVISSVLGAFVLIIMGTYDIYLILKDAVNMFSSKEFFKEFHKEALKYIVSAVDVYLIATVLLIFGLGLYELFISKIDPMEKDTKSSKILVVHTLDQLKNKLAKVIIMVLIVTFFKYAIEFKYQDIKELLFLSGGVFLIALSIYLMNKGQEAKK